MRRKRTIYFDDARHYYLYVFDPPMTMEEAWLPVDQVAGTAVDTFIYGVACGGLFYPSKVGKQFGELSRPFKGEYSAAYWSAWTNMQGLINQGLDPLTVLIDRAHEKGLDFVASVRMGVVLAQEGPGGEDGIDSAFKVSEGGRGFVHPEIRDYLFAVLEEVATQYATEGVELDFSAAPMALDRYFRPEDVAEHTPVMTEYVGKIAEMVRGRPSGRGVLGARVYPTEQINLDHGLDVRAWLDQGLVDFVVPMFYQPSLLDPDMPIEWIVEAAHRHDVSVYGFLHPDFRDESRRFHTRDYATTPMTRAAAANYYDKGVDGLYTWFLPWPLGHSERGLLTELGDPARLRDGDKNYNLRRRDTNTAEMGYEVTLPLQIPQAEPGKLYAIPFYVSDDIEGEAYRIRRVTLKINIFDLVSADRLTLLLNGRSLAGETCLRSTSSRLEPYYGQWLEFHLDAVRPRKGYNVLEVSLDERPPELEAGIRIDDVEIIIEYGHYPSGLMTAPKDS